MKKQNLTQWHLANLYFKNQSFIPTIKKFFMMKPYLITLLLSTLIACSSSQQDISQFDQLAGTWIEVTPYSDGVCDTLQFNLNQTIGLYTPFQGYKFKLAAQNKLIIYNSSLQYSFSFSLYEEGGQEKLEIYNFIDRSLTNNVKNIVFIKLK